MKSFRIGLAWALAAGAQGASLAQPADFAQGAGPAHAILAPQDFAYGYPIVSSSEASAYRIALPLAIYQGTVRADFGDLAVFNARGEVVPFFIRPIPAEGQPIWSTETVAARQDAHRSQDYAFDLGGHVPIQRVDLRLAEANSVVAADVYSRKDSRDAWNFVASARFYRIRTPRGDEQNEPIDVPLNRDRYWLVQISNPASAGALALVAAWHPSELVFLAQGDPPYLLAYGSSRSTAAHADFTPFISDLAVTTATLADGETLGGALRLVAPKPPFPRRRWILWLVLLGALAALGYMALRLFEETGRPEPSA